MENNYENFHFTELTEAQMRQYIDASASWRALSAAQAATSGQICHHHAAVGHLTFGNNSEA